MYSNNQPIPVSVIIPCYRCISTIGRALDSVINQTRLPAEVVLVDDASCDGTLDKLYALQSFHGDNFIKIIPLSRNYGPSEARNIGWDMANQPYIAFLDADDAWHPRKLEIQFEWMSEHPEVALTGHPCLKITNGVMPLILPVKWRSSHSSPWNLLLSNRFLTPSVMLHRDLPFRFDPEKRYSEDYLLWLKIVLSGHLAYVLDLPLAYLYKAHYGDGGLSENLWAMEKGELTNYKQLRDERMISNVAYCFLISSSLAKFLRRLILTVARRVSI